MTRKENAMYCLVKQTLMPKHKIPNCVAKMKQLIKIEEILTFHLPRSLRLNPNFSNRIQTNVFVITEDFIKEQVRLCMEHVIKNESNTIMNESNHTYISMSEWYDNIWYLANIYLPGKWKLQGYISK